MEWKPFSFFSFFKQSNVSKSDSNINCRSTKNKQLCQVWRALLKKCACHALEKLKIVIETLFKITCKKPRCKSFTYIGQTSNRFCDRFTDHKTYVSTKSLDQVCGYHFNLPGHSQEDMLPVILEEVYPKNDSFIRDIREKYWISTYKSIDFGANRKF